jgi:hypothetical protein
MQGLNMSENSVVQQILSNDRDGIRSFDENLIKGLAGLAEYDPIEYARRKPVAANELGVSQFDLDQLVKKVSQFPTLDKETGNQFNLLKLGIFWQESLLNEFSC